MMKADRKAEAKLSALSRLMPNIGGPRGQKGPKDLHVVTCSRRISTEMDESITV